MDIETRSLKMKKQYIGNNTVVYLLPFSKSRQSIMEERIVLQDEENHEDAFFIGDLGDIFKKYRGWRATFPRVHPFYAVKCNDSHAVLKLLADLGVSFDCASKAEIQKVLKLGVAPSRIIYANPCKQMSFIRYAAANKVAHMTFDNEPELLKVKAIYPDAKLVLRVLPPSDYKVQCELGMKFGCLPKNARQLLEAAKNLGLDVVGVSFHVGSGCEEAEAFAAAIQEARIVFDHGLELGFDMQLLDIGGGFPGQKSANITFEEIGEVVNMALDKYFPEDSGVQIIAEPGRYFVASAFTLAVNIIAKRVVAPEPADGECGEVSVMYYVNDGVYGSFNCLLYDHATVEVFVLQESDSGQQFTSSIWGPTCDGLDCIMKECYLPALNVGDWVYFEDMGAYTMAAASAFNGMPAPRRFYCCSSSTWLDYYPSAADKTEHYIRAVPRMRSGHSLSDTSDYEENLFGTSPAPDGLVMAASYELPDY